MPQGLPTLNQTLFVNANKLQITPTKRRLCEGDTTILQAYGATTEIFTWSGPAGLDSMTKASPRFVATTPGTFTWNVTGTSACTTATASVTIEVLPALPPITLGPDTILCPGEAFYPGPESMPGLSYRWNTGATTSRINASAAGKYWLTVTNGACSLTDTIVVSQRGQTRPTRPWVASGGLVACQGDSVLLAAPFTNYSQWLWSNGATTPSTWVRQTGWYKVQIGRADSCLSTWSDSLFIQFLPRRQPPQIVPHDTVRACAGDTVRLHAFVTTGAEPAYNWTGGATGPELKVTRSGSYRVRGDYGSPCPTDSSAPVTVLFFNQPAMPQLIAGDTITICPGDSSTLTVANPDPNLRYRWSTGDSATSLRVGAGLYRLRAIERQAGCQSPERVILVRPAIVPTATTITGITSVCPGSTGLVYKAQANTTALLWRVNRGSIVAQGGDSVVVNWQGTRANVAWVRVIPTNNTNCRGDSVTLPVRINPVLAPPAPQGDTVLCEGRAVAVYSIVSYPGAMVNWQASGGTVLNQTARDVTVAWGGPGLKTLAYTQSLSTADTVCFGQSSVLHVRVQPRPDSMLLVQGPVQVCPLDTVVYSLAGRPGSRYRWVLNGGVLADTGASIRLVFNAAGTNNLTVRETTAAGCVGKSINLNITVNPLPPVSSLLGANQTICSGDSLTIGLPLAPGYSYLWKRNEQAVSTAPSFRELLRNNGDQPLVIIYQLMATSLAAGCTDTGSFTVTVLPLPPSSAIGDSMVCAGRQINLGRPVVGIYQWRWRGPVQWLSDTLNNAPIFTAPEFLNDTVLTYVLAAQNINKGCIRLDTVRITVLAKPQINIVADTFICAGVPLPLLATMNQFPQAWRWTQNGALLSTSGSLMFYRLNPSTETLTDTLQVVGMNRITGCETVQRQVLVRTPPQPQPSLAHNNPWLCPDVTNSLTYSVQGLPGSRFNWTATGAASLLPSASGETATVVWEAPLASYSLTVQEVTASGCESQQVTLNLVIDQLLRENSGCDINNYPLLIPNIITPNGDGFNDRLVIENLQYYGNCALTLTNRWGQQVYGTAAYANDFDGKDLPAAVYFYQVTARGRVYTGWLQVVR